MLGLLFTLSPLLVDAAVYVNGYTKKNGTYVKPHYRSDPDGIKSNNYSYPGNTNPYTGKTSGGTVGSYGGSSYSPSYTPSYGGFTATDTTSEAAKKAYSNYQSACNYSGYGGTGAENCRKAVLDWMSTQTGSSNSASSYSQPESKSKKLKINELTLSYALENNCSSHFLTKSDQKTCKKYRSTKNDYDVEWKTIKVPSSSYGTCDGDIYSIHLKCQPNTFTCVNNVADCKLIEEPSPQPTQQATAVNSVEDTIRWVQDYLVANQFMTLESTSLHGTLTPRTVDAIKRYKKVNGLAVNETIDKTLIDKMAAK